MKLDFTKAPLLMGVVNVTPNSFSDGGKFFAPEAAIAQGRKLAAEGTDILDIGGEASNPGAEPISAEEEMARVLPVIRGLKGCGAVLSVDTYHAATMKAALAAGAEIINDITALTGDPDSMTVAAASQAYVCLMHMQGTPRTMQKAPSYGDVLAEIYDYLEQRIAACRAAGIASERIIVDPGIGFGKTLEHNLILLRNIRKFRELGAPVLIGASRKRFIDALCPGTPAEARLPGSLAAALRAAEQGAAILRIHDVAETRQALSVFGALDSDAP